MKRTIFRITTYDTFHVHLHLRHTVHFHIHVHIHCVSKKVHPFAFRDN